jgi:hypothetical protein
MNEEEKKAVGLLEALNNLEKKCKIEKVQYNSEIKKIAISLLPEDYGTFETILNLIKKLQNENELVKQSLIKSSNIADERNNLLAENQKLKQENEELKIVKSAIQTLQINSIEDEKYIVISKNSFLDGDYKHLLDDYISNEKIKEVIKELEENIYRIKKQYSNGGENCNTEYLENLAQVKILKQILKESEEDNGE